MKNKKLVCVVGIVVIVAIIILALFKTHILCIHEWNEAACDAPKTCSICGDTEGEPLTHEVNTWEITVKPTCSAEGEQQGSCVLCGKVLYDTVDKLDHTEGDWIVTEEYTINGDATVTPGTESLLCSVCNEVINTREYTIELTTGQKNALITANRLIDSIHPGHDFLVEELLVQCEGFSLDDARFAGDYCDADWNEQAVLKCNELISEGGSEKSVKEDMRFYGYNEEQIEYALSKSDFN